MNIKLNYQSQYKGCNKFKLIVILLKGISLILVGNLNLLKLYNEELVRFNENQKIMAVN